MVHLVVIRVYAYNGAINGVSSPPSQNRFLFLMIVLYSAELDMSARSVVSRNGYRTVL